MGYVLYFISGSPFAWRAMLALEIKGLPYDSHRLNASKGEHKTPEYLAMNPRGKVPVLKDGETVIYESIAILAYLDKKHPEPPLFGTTPRETGLIWQLVCEIAEYVHIPIGENVVAPIFRGKATGEGADAVREAVGPAHDALNWANDKLGLSAYLAGEAITAADIVLVPVIQSLARAAGKEEALALDLGILPIDQTYPNIAAWMTRIEALPGYDNTYPPHWRD